MSAPISRRVALTSAALATTAVAVPIIAHAAADPATDPDAELLALWHEMGATDRAFVMASYQQEMVECAAEPETPELLNGEERSPEGTMRQIRILHETTIQSVFDQEGRKLGWEAAAARRTTRRALIKEWHEEHERLKEAAGVPAMEAAARKLCEKTWELRQRISDAPAHGLLGIAIKLKLWRNLDGEIDYQPRWRGEAALVAALQEAERLTQRLPYYFFDGETGEDQGGSETTIIREEDAA